MTADLGLNPQNDGTNIKVPIPPLTEERRKEFVKLVKKFGEDAKIAIRNVRRDANEHLKKKQKDDKISEDLLKEAEAKVQKATNEHITEIEQILVHKEKEIMEV
jgi:ribosome recycling factor